jgi:hypothetical protein
MPLVPIDLRKGKDAAYRRDIGRAVYEAMVSVGVPVNDRFEVIAEHDVDNVLFDRPILELNARTISSSFRSPGAKAARSIRRRRSTRP